MTAARSSRRPPAAAGGRRAAADTAPAPTAHPRPKPSRPNRTAGSTARSKSRYRRASRRRRHRSTAEPATSARRSYRRARMSCITSTETSGRGTESIIAAALLCTTTSTCQGRSASAWISAGAMLLNAASMTRVSDGRLDGARAASTSRRNHPCAARTGPAPRRVCRGQPDRAIDCARDTAARRHPRARSNAIHIVARVCHRDEAQPSATRAARFFMVRNSTAPPPGKIGRSVFSTSTFRSPGGAASLRAWHHAGYAARVSRRPGRDRLIEIQQRGGALLPGKPCGLVRSCGTQVCAPARLEHELFHGVTDRRPATGATTSNPASPTTSGRLVDRMAMTAAPHAIASTTGRPKPSYSDG